MPSIRDRSISMDSDKADLAAKERKQASDFEAARATQVRQEAEGLKARRKAFDAWKNAGRAVAKTAPPKAAKQPSEMKNWAPP